MTCIERKHFDPSDPANRHRPTDRRGFLRAAAELREQGLCADDVAACLRLTPATVRDLWRELDHGQHRTEGA